jgi:hypothetical protein
MGGMEVFLEKMVSKEEFSIVILQKKFRKLQVRCVGVIWSVQRQEN